MAALDVEVEQTLTTPARRGRWVFWLAVAWIAIVASAAIAADWLPLSSPSDMDLLARRAGPSADHWLGTDALGRDILSRLVFGARISLTVGLIAPMLGLAIGGGLGMLAGYFRGRFETLVVGGIDVLLAFPPLVLALAITTYLASRCSTSRSLSASSAFPPSPE
jgi:peptide/nickel transport system permease protein